MDIKGFKFPDELHYHEEHTYARIEGDLVIVGVTDFTQKMAGTIKRVVTLDEDDEVSLGKPCGTMSSGKWTGKLYSPITGEIVEVNEDLEDDPDLVNTDPYGDGWILKIEPEDMDEIKKLMDIQKVSTWILEEMKKDKYKDGLEKL